MLLPSLWGGCVGRACEANSWIRAELHCPPSLPWHTLPGFYRGVPQKQVCLMCGDTCNDIVLAPLREGEIPAPTFEAGCKHLLPHAEPELNPDGPSLAVSLRPPSLLPPCLQGCFLTASSLTVCF